MNPFILRTNTKNYYITYAIIIICILTLIAIICTFTKPSDTIKLPTQPERPYWPSYIDDKGNKTTRRIIDYTPGEGVNSDLMIFDRWSLSHISHGIIFFFILFGLKMLIKKYYKVSIPTSLLIIIALIIEIIWEFIENSQFIVNKLTPKNLTRNGDSIVNSLGDITCCVTGFLFASISPAAGLTYLVSEEYFSYPQSVLGLLTTFFKN